MTQLSAFGEPAQPTSAPLTFDRLRELCQNKEAAGSAFIRSLKPLFKAIGGTAKGFGSDVAGSVRASGPGLKSLATHPATKATALGTAGLGGVGTVGYGGYKGVEAYNNSIRNAVRAEEGAKSRGVEGALRREIEKLQQSQPAQLAPLSADNFAEHVSAIQAAGTALQQQKRQVQQLSQQRIQEAEAVRAKAVAEAEKALAAERQRYSLPFGQPVPQPVPQAPPRYRRATPEEIATGVWGRESTGSFTDEDRVAKAAEWFIAKRRERKLAEAEEEQKGTKTESAKKSAPEPKAEKPVQPQAAPKPAAPPAPAQQQTPDAKPSALGSLKGFGQSVMDGGKAIAASPYALPVGVGALGAGALGYMTATPDTFEGQAMFNRRRRMRALLALLAGGGLAAGGVAAAPHIQNWWNGKKGSMDIKEAAIKYAELKKQASAAAPGKLASVDVMGAARKYAELKKKRTVG